MKIKECYTSFMKELYIGVRSYFIGVGVSIVVLQVISMLLNTIADVQLMKFGYAFLLLAAIVAISTLYTLGTRIGDLENRDILFAVLVLGGVVAFYYYLPQITPEIFSTVPRELGAMLN